MADELNFKETQIYNEIINDEMMHSIMLISHDKDMLDFYAYKIVCTMFCSSENKPCGVCPNCQKIKHNNMVDVLTYPKDEDVLKSTELSELIDSVYELPFEHSKKVYIINNFSDIDILMQNKLLKTLEEPPNHAYFILKVTNETAVLPTIKSRCQKILLPKMDKNALIDCLQQNNADIDIISMSVAFCDGSLALAKQYASSTTFAEDVDFVFDLLLNFKKSWQMVDYASVLYNKKDEILDIIHIYLKILQDTTYHVLGLNDLITLTKYIDKLDAIGKQFSLDAMIQMIKDTTLVIEKLERNCNYNTIVDEFLLGILEDKHKWPVT